MGESPTAETLKASLSGNVAWTPRSVTTGAVWAAATFGRSKRRVIAGTSTTTKCRGDRLVAPTRCVDGRLITHSLLQIRVHQTVNLSVENSFRIAGLEACAMVLHHLIRMQDVR